MDLKHVLFVQKGAHKAGAQSCLERVLRQLAGKALEPILLVSEEGWLTEQCRRNAIKIIRLRFPSSRSLASRLYGTRSFGRRVEAALHHEGLRPPIIQGNDHPETLLTLHLARRLGARSSVTLRTPDMAHRDYVKYRCGSVDLLMAVSQALQEAVQGWDPGRCVTVVPDGLSDEEFLPPKEPPVKSPKKILVLGNAAPRKGWQDLLDALAILERAGKVPSLDLDFPDQRPPRLKPTHAAHTRSTLNFIGHHNDFRSLVRRYDLVLNPSRSESFGMAALEVVAAGVPLISSRSGVIEEVIRDPRFLFEPRNPHSLASALGDLLRQWPASQIHLEPAQQRLREQFHIERGVQAMLHQYRMLDP